MANLTYFKKFDTKSDYDAYIGGEPVLPNVSIVANEDVYFKDGEGPEPPHDYSQDYLTFVVLDNGTSIVSELDSIEFSTDGGLTWTSGETGNLSTGDKVLVRGNVKSGGESSPLFRTNEGSVNVEGNIMSIYDSEGFRTRTSFDNEGDNLYWVFYQMTGLISAENLVLPVTAMTSHCYYGMFYDCTSLTAAPVLPATTLANNCYNSMFLHCTSLTTAPALPATTLAYSCYDSMFNGCTGLTGAPVLPATTLSSRCYYDMFANCTSLTSAPELPATTLTENCYDGMFYSCTSLTVAPSILPATTLAQDCYSGMFEGCTSLTTAPELPATTLAESCYESMFEDCTNLNYLKCLATDISAERCTYNWVSNVSPSGTFVKNANMSS